MKFLFFTISFLLWAGIIFLLSENSIKTPKPTMALGLGAHKFDSNFLTRIERENGPFAKSHFCSGLTHRILKYLQHESLIFTTPDTSGT